MNILLVEDEAVIAMDIESILEGAGYGRVITTTSVAAALRKLNEQAFDGAVLDINLGKENTVAVADELSRRDIPFLLVTGHDSGFLPPHLRGRPVIRKPYAPNDVVRMLGTAMRANEAKLN